MKWPRGALSTRGKVLPVAVFTLGAAFLLYSAMLSDTVANASSFDSQQVVSAPAATFAADAASLGAIPDHAAGCDATGAAPRNVTFTVSGLSGNVSSVEVTNLTFGGPIHSWVGDIEAVLIAPNGASHTLFGRTGETTAAGCDT